MEEKPTTSAKAINDIEALQKCSSYIDRVEPPQDRQRVVKYLQEKYLVAYGPDGQAYVPCGAGVVGG